MATAEVPAFARRGLVRFGTTVVANVVRGGLSIITGVVVARRLGAASYGDLNFLLGSFVALNQVLEMGTSNAFYTFIARRPRAFRFLAAYITWLGLQLGVSLLAVGVLLPSSTVGWIWVAAPRRLVVLACLASFLTTQLWTMVSQLGEATRRTVYVQVLWIGQAALHLALVLVAWYGGWLSVGSVLALMAVEYLGLVLIFGPRLAEGNLASLAHSADTVRSVVGEFFDYCQPLILYSWFGAAYTFADRWMLQRFGGSVQQGFFSIGQQFSYISLLAATSVLKVFWKEVAEARERGDHARALALYTKTTRSLYFVCCVMSCLLIPYSRDILARTVGTSYASASWSLALMLLFPVHQALGQIQGTLLFASGQTRSYARIGIVMMAVSIPVTYVVLAPPTAAVPGLGLGALGLAAKLVVLQLVAVTLQGFVVARDNGWTFDYLYQAVDLAVLLPAGWLCRLVTGERLWAAGPLYVMCAIALMYLRPSLVGVTRDQLIRGFKEFAAGPRAWQSRIAGA